MGAEPDFTIEPIAFSTIFDSPQSNGCAGGDLAIAGGGLG